MAKYNGDFSTRVAGIPCQVDVTYYQPGEDYCINSASLEPNAPEEFEFNLLDRKGYPAAWLESKMTESDIDRILEEYLDLRNERMQP